MEHSWSYCGNGVLYIQKKTASWNNRGFQTPTFRGKEFRTEMHYVICAGIACTHIAWRRIRLENPLNQCVQVKHCNIHGWSSANLRVITEDSRLFCNRAIWRKSRTLLLWSRPTHDADFHGCAALVYKSIMQLNSFRLSVHACMLADGHSQGLENPDVICRFSILSHFLWKQKSSSQET